MDQEECRDKVLDVLFDKIYELLKTSFLYKEDIFEYNIKFTIFYIYSNQSTSPMRKVV